MDLVAKKVCSRCGCEKPLTNFKKKKAAHGKEWRRTYCQACINPAEREKRRRIEAKRSDSFKRAVRAATRKAIKKGKLVRQPCECCGATPAEAHHDDYRQPFNVRWLCPAHHREHHRNVA